MYVKDIMSILLGASNLTDEYVYNSSKDSNQQFKDVLDHSIMKSGVFEHNKYETSLKRDLAFENVKPRNPGKKSRPDLDFMNKTDSYRLRDRVKDGAKENDSKAVDSTYKEHNQSDSQIRETSNKSNKEKNTEKDSSKDNQKSEDVIKKVKELMDRLCNENLSQDEMVLIMNELSLALQPLIGLIAQQEPMEQFDLTDILNHQFLDDGEDKNTVGTIADIHDKINDIIKNLDNLNNEKFEELTTDSNLIKDAVVSMDGLEKAKEELSTGLQQGGSQNGELGLAILSEKTNVIDLRNMEEGNFSLQSPAAEIKNDIIASEIVKEQGAVFSKEHVIKQVLGHARLTLVTEEKSEMLIQLKPDHLGKLSLKLVTERGMLIAKFTAESQQVKEIIESNLEQLKDALEAQGLNVKGFSVSVGDNDAQKMNYGSNRRLLKNPLGEGDTENAKGISGYDITNASINPYLVSNSSIDFTA